jgi:phosphohistidine swiveling domain-containing protein
MNGEPNDRFFQWGPRESAVLPLVLTLEGAMSMDSVVGVPWPTTWVLFLPDGQRRACRLSATWLTGKAELIEAGRRAFEYIADRGVDTFFGQLRDATSSLDSQFATIAATDLSSLSDSDVAALYESFRSAYVTWWRPFYVVEPLEYYSEAHARSAFGDPRVLSLAAKLPDRTMDGDLHMCLDEIVDAALSVPEATRALLNKEMPAFAKVVARTPRLLELVQSCQQKFFWIRNNYYRSGALTFDQTCMLVLDHAVHIRKAASGFHGPLEGRLRALAREQILGASTDPRDGILLDLWDRMAQFKDDRKRTNLIANHHLDLILREAARRRKVPLADIRNLLPGELSAFLHGDFPSSLISRRCGMVVLWRSGDSGLQCLYTPDLAALAHGGIAQQFVQSAGEMKSITKHEGIGNGYGTVEGIAYFCPTLTDALRIPAGQNAILVTYMTSPEWLGVMSRVSGVVTLEGGQASHAYLSCSQMKKPLIINARTAVTAAVNGATVRLDADAGVLHVLK